MELSKLWCIVVLGLVVVGCASQSPYRLLTTMTDAQGQRWVIYENESGRQGIVTVQQWDAGELPDVKEGKERRRELWGRIALGAADALAHPQQQPRAWQEPVRQQGNAVSDSTGKRGLVIGNGVLMPNGRRYLTITDGFGQRWITDDHGRRVRVR